MSKSKTLLIVFGTGGHTSQMLKLINLLGNKFNYAFVIQKEDPLAQNKINVEGKVFFVNNPRLYAESYFVSFLRTLRSLYQTFLILIKSNSDAVITAGPGVGVPFCYLAKIFGKKVIFLESWSRVYNKSLSGKLVYPIADLFFVQWEDLKKKYPKAIYAGR